MRWHTVCHDAHVSRLFPSFHFILNRRFCLLSPVCATISSTKWEPMWVKRRGFSFAEACIVGVGVGVGVGIVGVVAVGILVGATAGLVGAVVGATVDVTTAVEGAVEVVGAAAVGASASSEFHLESLSLDVAVVVGARAGGPFCFLFLHFPLFLFLLNCADSKVTLSPPIGSDGVGAGICSVASGTL